MVYFEQIFEVNLANCLPKTAQGLSASGGLFWVIEDVLPSGKGTPPFRAGGEQSDLRHHLSQLRV